jgi:L-lactate dehydrogenase complex protein LldE
MRIALFVTCLGDTLAPRAGIATATVLERLGHEVAFPAGQTCCGQMHANSGYRDEALRIARGFVRTFAAERCDAVVAPSGSCVAMVREQLPQLAEDAGEAQLAADARRLAGRVFELSELLVHELGVEDVGATFPHRVAYHPACHSLRVLRIGDAPLRLLRAVRGLELVELPEASACCGFGGLFSTKLHEVSGAMLADKLAALRASGAEVCTAVDGSCLMHIGGGLSRAGGGARALHLAEILASTGAEARAGAEPAA